MGTVKRLSWIETVDIESRVSSYVLLEHNSGSRVPSSIVNETLGRNPDYYLFISRLKTFDVGHHEPESVEFSNGHRGTARTDLWLNRVVLLLFSLLHVGEDLRRGVLIEPFIFYTGVKRIFVSYLRPRLL
jgi:hypothetical protein